MGARIEVRNAITIKGRGPVLIGYLRSGAVHVGQITVSLPLDQPTERRLEVVAVERLTSTEGDGPAIGLVFRDPPSLRALELVLPPGSILLLEETGPPD
jgi:translation elongation factor EF-Tu-like GTPase